MSTPDFTTPAAAVLRLTAIELANSTEVIFSQRPADRGVWYAVKADGRRRPISPQAARYLAHNGGLKLAGMDGETARYAITLTAQRAPGGGDDSDPIADTPPDLADALDARQCLYGGHGHD